MTKENRFEGTVTFRHRNILQIDGRTIETPDIFPHELQEVVDLIDDQLRLHMPEIASEEQVYRPTESRFLRPVILIARLALIDQPYNALTQQALISKQRHIVHSALLTDEALPYWTAVERTQFNPQAHVIEGAPKDFSGVWLGVSEKS